MKNTFMLLFVLLTGTLTQAQQKPNKNATHNIQVSGNCEMCKKRIEKAALSTSGVKSAIWYQDVQTLHVILNEKKTSPTAVCQSIAKAGHDTELIKAQKEDYDNLHGCCKYSR